MTLRDQLDQIARLEKCLKRPSRFPRNDDGTTVEERDYEVAIADWFHRGGRELAEDGERWREERRIGKQERRINHQGPLAPGGQNAAPQVSPAQESRESDRKGSALPAEAAPDELRKAYFEGYEDALKDRSAPAEVAEGAPDMELKKLIENAPVGDFGNELRAAPSLSREEATSLEQIDAMIAAWFEEANKPGATFVSRMEAALRAKVREAAKSRP
jgi:hypothetical protein